MTGDAGPHRPAIRGGREGNTSVIQGSGADPRVGGDLYHGGVVAGREETPAR